MPRSPLIDLLKTGAAQLIVLHHLAFYGPLSDAVHARWPAPVEWLYDYGRMAVQVFLVIAGFLAAQSLARSSDPHPLKLLSQRYLRLALPFAAALLVAILCAALARLIHPHPAIPDPPEFAQVLAHLFFVHDLLDHDALSAGVWYIAIDFQLFALLLGIGWLTRHHPTLLPATLIALAAASLLWFNRHQHWDEWGLYFFGSYALGALTAWSGQTGERRWQLIALTLGLLALLLEFRLRIAVALLTALALGLLARASLRSLDRPLTRALGDASYALFLLHFPLALILNALTHRLAPGALWPAIGGLCAIWLLSNLAALAWLHWLERPLHELLRRKARPT